MACLVEWYPGRTGYAIVQDPPAIDDPRTIINGYLSTIKFKTDSGETAKFKPDEVERLSIKPSKVAKIAMLSESASSINEVSKSDFGEIVNRHFGRGPQFPHKPVAAQNEPPSITVWRPSLVTTKSPVSRTRVIIEANAT